MLEACGLKGHRIGGAQISPRHANFIENADGATTADALALMTEARRRALGAVRRRARARGRVPRRPRSSCRRSSTEPGPRGRPARGEFAAARERGRGARRLHRRPCFERERRRSSAPAGVRRRAGSRAARRLRDRCCVAGGACASALARRDARTRCSPSSDRGDRRAPGGRGASAKRRSRRSRDEPRPLDAPRSIDRRGIEPLPDVRARPSRTTARSRTRADRRRRPSGPSRCCGAATRPGSCPRAGASSRARRRRLAAADLAAPRDVRLGESARSRAVERDGSLPPRRRARGVSARRARFRPRRLRPPEGRARSSDGDLDARAAPGVELRLGPTAATSRSSSRSRHACSSARSRGAAPPAYVDVSVPERPVGGGAQLSSLKLEG